MLRNLVFCLAGLWPIAAYAYIGPGAGITAFGSLLALFAAILLAIIGFVFYPIKNFLKRRHKTSNAIDADEKANAP
jgi:ATP/ADP translocase